MAERLKKEVKWIPIGLAVLVLALLLVYVGKQTLGKEKEEYRIVCLGDSIIGNIRDETSVTSVMESILGEPVANGAFGGTCASLSNSEYRPTFYEDSLNLAALVDAIVTDNYEVQFYDISSNRFQLPYFAGALDELAQVDFSKAEIVFIEHGINDYSAGRPLDNPDNPKDVYTYGGALRYAIERLQEAYPQLQIVLVTPLYCYFQEYGVRTSDSETLDLGYGVLERYVETEMAIAEEYNLPCIDNFHNMGLNSSNIDDLTIDGIHLNDKGRAILAKVLADYVKSN